MRALAATTSRATCEGCGALHEVSVPTPGFRCETCIVAASDAESARTRRHALAILGLGAVLLVLAGLVWSTGHELAFGPPGRELPLAIWIGLAGVGCGGVGAGKLSFRPKLKL